MFRRYRWINFLGGGLLFGVGAAFYSGSGFGFSRGRPLIRFRGSGWRGTAFYLGSGFGVVGEPGGLTR